MYDYQYNSAPYKLDDIVESRKGRPMPGAPLVVELLKRVAETWGKMDYPTDWIKLPSQRRWEYETAIKLLDVPEGSRVLDAGAGRGYMSYILSQHYDVVFNDRHDCYSQPPAPVQKIIGSFFTLPERPLFDAIVCISVLEHVPPARRLDWLKKIHQLLQPGGVAVLTFEWSSTGVFDIGDGLTLSTAQLEKLWAAMPLEVTAQLESPTCAENSRGWLPLAVRLVRGK